MLHKITLAFISLLLSFPLYAADIEKVAADFEAYMAKAMVRWGVPGAAIAIVKDDKIITIRGFGVRQAGRPEKVDGRTVFRLASLSKGLSAGLVGTYVADGTLDWHDPVVTYLPDFELSQPAQTDRLMIINLLSHTTGLPQHTYTDLVESNTPYPQIIDRLDQVKMVCGIGECHGYQNVTYSMLGDVVEKVSGKPFPQAMDDRIFTPLKMHDASATYEEFMAAPNRAACHTRGGGKYVPCTVTPNYYRVAPAGGMNASAADMAQWLRAQMGGYPKQLPPDILRDLQTPLIRTPAEMRYTASNAGWRKERVKNAHYGMGWRVYDYAGKKLVFHGGMVRGFQNVIAFMPEERVGFVVLTNSNDPIAGLLTARFFDMYLGLPAKDWSSIALANLKR
jgi:beta-lactamase class C